jgi:hypothetical protein
LDGGKEVHPRLSGHFCLGKGGYIAAIYLVDGDRCKETRSLIADISHILQMMYKT